MQIVPDASVGFAVPPSELAEHRSLSRSSARALFEPESFFDSGELRSARLKRGAQGTGSKRPRRGRAARGGGVFLLGAKKKVTPPAAREPHLSGYAVAAGDSTALTLALSQRERE